LGSRLGAVRGFARHLQGVDPTVEVPPANLIAGRPCRRIAYQFSPEDLERLVGAAGRLTPTIRGETYQAFFGLLICSGARVGEAIKLDRGDVDLPGGVIAIDDTKFRKHRRLPLRHSTVAALQRYAQLRDKLCPSPKAPSFFISTRGTRLIYVVVNEVFRKLVNDIGLKDQPGVGHPRIHDLRHHFIMANLADFHRQGADPQGKLPVLSAYVGHSDPAWTYHYMQPNNEPLALAAQRLKQFERGQR
jgi:integrase/recombinase XerD